MGVHKLTAGDGYTYLTRQVAAHDGTDRGHRGLADYYAEKGESPGRWFGAGLDALDLQVGAEVTEAQMRNLFGEGRHPDAERLEDAALDTGASVASAKRASQLGRLFAVYRGSQPEFIQETARRYIAHNLAQRAHWATPVPAAVRAQIRTELGDEMFGREHGRAPLDDRERGSFMAVATRQQTTAVAGYDLTFTPVKSVSTLWALADRQVARHIEAAHHAAVEATLIWLQHEVLFTRRGRGGIQQVKARGLVAGLFTHRDARSSDPHLHTHVAVSNKVQDLSGRWLAVDGRVLFKANVTLSETYNTRLEAELVARLGVRFADRGQGRDKDVEKRPVREIVGVDPRLATAWSKRDTAIEARRRDLATAFQAAHGRPPTHREAVTLKEQAWEQTRRAKHEPRAEADQRAAWRAEATTILGGDWAVPAMVAATIDHAPTAPSITDEWVVETAQLVVDRVAEDRATWQIWHLRAEAQRRARAHGIRLPDVDDAIDRVIDTAIDDHCLRFDDPDPLTGAATAAALRGAVPVRIPAALQRTDNRPGAARGTGASGEVVSVYSLAGSAQYTSRAVIDAERRILEAAGRCGGRTISGVRVGIAMTEAAASSDTPGDAIGHPNGDTTVLHLNAGQRSLVREMATSGRAVQLALAPAGTGKTTAMRVLTHAWQDSGGTVIGLAPSAVAAHELSRSINPNDDTNNNYARGERRRLSLNSSRSKVPTDTLAKLVWHAENGGAPPWMQRIDHKTLVLVDEAGMASTTALATAIDYITSRGGQVRLIGDDKQLASVAAGGVLRDIAHHVGAITLNEVHRFSHRDGTPNHAEAAATLALRQGDPSAIAFYADRGRIHVGDIGSCAEQAYAAWTADRAAGTDSVLIAPTRELVAELNTRARNDRTAALTADLTAGRAAGVGRELVLADGTLVSAGDRIVTRENDRHLRLTNTDWVKNGDRWTVTRVDADGSLTAVHDALNKTITLPAAYAAAHVQLGYATTVHGAQGITTGTSHVVLTGEEDRNLLYVALSRGRYANDLYLNVAGDGDPHNLIHPEALIPPTALDRLAEMLCRDGSPVSATTTMLELRDPHQLLGDYAARYHDAVTTGAETFIDIGPGGGMNKIDTHAEALLTGLTDAPAWPTLRSHLALLALEDHNPLHLLDTAIALGSLADARDPAAVLDARIDAYMNAQMNALAPVSAAGPLPWLPPIPARLADDLDWGPFLATYDQLARAQVNAVREEARAWTGVTAPTWAQPFIDDEQSELLADLRADLAVWRAVTRTPDADLRPTGERAIGAPGVHQTALNRSVREARPTYPYAQRDWYRALPDTVRADPWITPLCQRLARLDRAGLPVADFIHRAVQTDPTDTAPAPQPLSSPAEKTTGEGGLGRPLPDEHHAAALWWRLVPYLGPAALEADHHSADLLQPTWRTTLTKLVGAPRADYLQKTPAWPALVAAVDEAQRHHDWTPHEILATGLSRVPRDGRLTGIEVAEALVLRIATLTDQPPVTGYDDTSPGLYDPPTDPAPERDLLPPDDADELMQAHYRDLPDDQLVTINGHSPALTTPVLAGVDGQVTGDSRADTGGNSDGDAATDATDWMPPVRGPYLPPLPWEEDAPSTEDAFPDPHQVPTERIHELNQQALAYYESCYPRSWAPDYLRRRLHTDLSGHPNFTAGYAPPGPRSMLNHLTSHGAHLDELEQAGLIRTRDRHNGTTEYIDVFRDRLMMPIRDPQDDLGQAIVGFIGRRNPTKTDTDYAGPKYLNSKTTTTFTKGAALFGYAEAADLLAAGATPVIVEGPLDAYAITLGSSGTAVGVAPMGTALTVEQIKLLLTHVDLVNGRDRIAVAPDPAGWKAAQTAFWNLTAADLDPTLLKLPDNLDPADLFATQGPDAVTAALQSRVPLGQAMIDHHLRTHGSWADPNVRQATIEYAAHVLSARGPETWLHEFERIRNRLHLSPGILEHQTITESIDRDRDAIAYAAARIADLPNSVLAPSAHAPAVPGPGRAQRSLTDAPAPPRSELAIGTGDTADPDRSGPSR